MKKIIKYVIVDILRNKIVLAYTLCLVIFSFSIFNLEDNTSKGLLSLLNIILIIVPLISIIFSAIYVYNSAEFIELLMSQPLLRKQIWVSLFSGLTVSLVVAFLIGVAIPVCIYEPTVVGLTITCVGILLTIIFIAIAMLATLITRDKAKGIGIVILLWLYFSLLFDGLVLFLEFQFADYPMEKIMIGVSMLNPIDLGRILVLLKMDVSALMGYTGAVFKDFFGTGIGLISSLIVMLLWIVVPVMISVIKFNKKDM